METLWQDLRYALGRGFLPHDDRDPTAAPVVMLSHATWQQRLASDAAIVGKALTLNGRSYTVVGVAPAGFTGLVIGFSPDVWTPMSMHQAISPATGARRGDVMRLILGHGLRLTLIGMAIGIVCAAALTWVLRSVLYGITATDPVSFLAVAAMLTVVALAASYVPARWATRVDPMRALRTE